MSKTVFRSLLTVAFACAPLLAQNGFTFPNFSSTSGLTLNGSAAQAGSVLRLTNNGGGEAGSTWFNTQQDVADGFTTTFQFQITGGNPGKADGIAFVIQNFALGALGGGGGGIGYSGISNSLALELDILQNAYDPNNNHAAVQSCGTAPNTPDHSFVACNLGINSVLPITLRDGNVHTAVIRYLPGTLTLSLDGTTALTVPLNLSSKLNLNGGQAWVGFTAGTGASTATQDILSWSFNSLADAFQIGYAANLAVGFSNINITSAGTLGGTDPAGDICAHVYVFSEDQQLIECCSCRLTPNHLRTFSVTDLIANTLTPGAPLGITVGLLATADPGAAVCDAASVDPASLASGMRAWGTVVHSQPGGGFAVTENRFLPAPLSVSELAKMTSFCGFAQADGSFFGICKTCGNGAAGATKQ